MIHPCAYLTQSFNAGMAGRNHVTELSGTSLECSMVTSPQRERVKTHFEPVSRRCIVTAGSRQSPTRQRAGGCETRQSCECRKPTSWEARGLWDASPWTNITKLGRREVDRQKARPCSSRDKNGAVVIPAPIPSEGTGPRGGPRQSISQTMPQGVFDPSRRSGHSSPNKYGLP